MIYKRGDFLSWSVDAADYWPKTVWSFMDCFQEVDSLGSGVFWGREIG